MKNNILLILAVTIISIGIIIATVMISGAGSDTENEPRSPQSTTTASAQSTLPADTTQQTTTPAPTTPPPAATTEPAETSDPHDYGDMAQSIIATAHSLIGIDFADGCDTPEAGFDNSGFIYYVLRENGYIGCPRGVYEQSQMGAPLTYEELSRGDLAFFYAEDMTTVSFGGIYIGDGLMVACLMPGTQVKEINITTPYYINHFYRGVSIT